MSTSCTSSAVISVSNLLRKSHGNKRVLDLFETLACLLIGNVFLPRQIRDVREYRAGTIDHQVAKIIEFTDAENVDSEDQHVEAMFGLLSCAERRHETVKNQE
jgi:hypothetical protein